MRQEMKSNGEFMSANILGVELRDTGNRGGDSGHGGRVLIKFKNIGSTDMRVNGQYMDEFTLFFGGDSERDTLIAALKFIVKELEDNEKAKGVLFSTSNSYL